VKAGSPVIPRFKLNISTAVVQNEPLKSLEIFARDIVNNSARYVPLVSAANIKELSTQDVLFLMPRLVIQSPFF
jgi:hypothetical protein